jgi:N-acetylmuramoyl-L-alanine amidase
MVSYKNVLRFWFDFGHGKLRSKDGAGDPGAVNEKEGLIEADLVEIIGKHAADYLEANYEGFVIGYSRTNDSFVSLENRAKKANDWKADVFFSIHINSAAVNTATGYESYIYNVNPSPATVALQNVVNKHALAAAKKYGLGAHGGNASRRANYSVLRNTDMPAILTETAYINSKDAKLLKLPQFLKDMGIAYAKGLAEFTGLKKKEAPEPPKVVSTPSNTSDGTKLLVVEYDGKDGLNYRSKPDYDAKPVGVARKGEAFTIVGESGDFYKVKSGYYFTKNSKYVSVKKK